MRGLSTVAGSWIGGGANQAAMKEIFHVGDDIFSSMIAVDVLVANVWLAFLLYGAGIHKTLDKKLKADTTAITELKQIMEDYRYRILRFPDLSDLITPWISKYYPSLSRFSLTSGFFWLIVIATTIAIGLSFTRARELEGSGASRYGSLFFIYW